MSKLPPPVAPKFFKPTSTLTRLTILTQVESWYAHYDHAQKVPYKCGGSICRYCDAGRAVELRFVLGCSHAILGRVTIELRERHRDALQRIIDRDGGIVGTVIDIYKAGEAKNSPVEFEVRGYKASPEWDIRLLVESLGGRPPNPQENPE